MAHYTNPTKSDAACAGILHSCLLTLVVLSGVFFRLYGIGAESIDLEEYACVGGIDAPTWKAFFEGQRILYPYGAPLAPALIYLWTHVVGGSIVAIRLLFAGVSIISLLLCYWMVQVFFHECETTRRRRAGLVVTLCVALSPVHVFHAQEARMYALVSLFTILSMTGLAQGLRGGGRRWWALNCIANAGLLASHYFTVFLLPVQGLALLFREGRLSLRLVLWSAAQGALLVLLLLWVSRIPRQAEDLYSYYGLPSLSIILAHLVAGDSTTLSANSFFPSNLAWNWLPGTCGAFLRNQHRVFDGALVGVSLLVFTGACGMLMHRMRRRNWRAAWLWGTLLLWALLPTLIIVAASYFWRPMYGSRYVMYSVFGYYLMLGGLTTLIRRSGAYALLFLLLLLLYGYQLGLALPAQTRTAWRQSLEAVRARSEGDPVLLLEDPFWLPVLKRNEDPDHALPIAAAFTRDSLCGAAGFLSPFLAETDNLWVLLVLTTDFDETPFMHCLEEHDLAYDRFHYPGERRLALYGIRREPDASPGYADEIAGALPLFGPMISTLQEPEHREVREDWDLQLRFAPDPEGGFWMRLALTLSGHGNSRLAASAFWRALETHGSVVPALAGLAEDLGIALEEGAVIASGVAQRAGDGVCAFAREALQSAYYARDMELLETFARGFRETAPQCAEGSAFIGMALHQAEAHREALVYFEEAWALNPGISPEIAEAYGVSLAATGAYESAIAVFLDALNAWPHYHWLHMRLGAAYADAGRHVEAVTAYYKALEPNPDDFYINYLLIHSLLALGHYEEALPMAQRPVVADRPEFWVHLTRWRVFVGARRHQDAEATLRHLVSLNPDLDALYDALYQSPNLATARELLEASRNDNVPLAPELAIAVEALEQGER